MFRKFATIIGSLALMTFAAGANATDVSPENTLFLDLKDGRVTIQLLPDIAPKHVERIKKLTAEGFYDGISWHRVIDGFMAQTGDPTGTGTGGSSYEDIPAEFSQYAYKRGTIGMARTADPNSANSQFFICFTDDGCSFLTGQYTVWGQVTEGMELVDKIARGEPPASPDKIVKLSLGNADAAATTAPAAPAAAETAPAAGQ